MRINREVGGKMKLTFYTPSKDWKDEFGLGMESGSLGKLRRAEKHFSKAIELAPREPYPHYELGYTLSLMQDYKSALRQFIIVNDLSPAFLQAQTEEYLCRQALSQSLDHATIRLIRRIQFLIEKQEFEGEEAIEMALTVVQSAPDCPLSYFYLAIAVGDTDSEAHESALRRCLALNPDDTTAIYASARLLCLLRNSGRFHEAKVLCSLTRKLFSEHIHLVSLCDFFQDRDDYQSAALISPLAQASGNYRFYTNQLLR